jgi:hypothetical protein
MRRRFFNSFQWTIILLLLSAGSFPPWPNQCDHEICYYLPVVSQDITVKVNEIQGYSSRAVECWFIGDVISSGPVREVVVGMRFFGDDGMPTYFGSTVLEATLPGQLNLFVISTDVDARRSCESQLQPIVTSWIVDYERTYRSATIVSVSYDEGDYGSWVTAEIRNDETSPLLNVKGLIWVLDSDANLDPIEIADSLAPGESAVFSEYVTGKPATSNIHVSAQGIVQP